jgi:hypothetical protein
VRRGRRFGAHAAAAVPREPPAAAPSAVAARPVPGPAAGAWRGVRCGAQRSPPPPARPAARRPRPPCHSLGHEHLSGRHPGRRRLRGAPPRGGRLLPVRAPILALRLRRRAGRPAAGRRGLRPVRPRDLPRCSPPGQQRGPRGEGGGATAKPTRPPARLARKARCRGPRASLLRLICRLASPAGRVRAPISGPAFAIPPSRSSRALRPVSRAWPARSWRWRVLGGLQNRRRPPVCPRRRATRPAPDRARALLRAQCPPRRRTAVPPEHSGQSVSRPAAAWLRPRTMPWPRTTNHAVGPWGVVTAAPRTTGKQQAPRQGQQVRPRARAWGGWRRVPGKPAAWEWQVAHKWSRLGAWTTRQARAPHGRQPAHPLSRAHAVAAAAPAIVAPRSAGTRQQGLRGRWPAHVCGTAAAQQPPRAWRAVGAAQGDVQRAVQRAAAPLRPRAAPVRPPPPHLARRTGRTPRPAPLGAPRITHDGEAAANGSPSRRSAGPAGGARRGAAAVARWRRGGGTVEARRRRGGSAAPPPGPGRPQRRGHCRPLWQRPPAASAVGLARGAPRPPATPRRDGREPPVHRPRTGGTYRARRGARARRASRMARALPRHPLPPRPAGSGPRQAAAVGGRCHPIVYFGSFCVATFRGWIRRRLARAATPLPYPEPFGRGAGPDVVNPRFRALCCASRAAGEASLSGETGRATQ